MPEITIIYTYYGQEEMIPKILAEKHPATRIVIVDDCSPEPLHMVDGLDIYRVDDDIAWNAGGAANLGFQESEGWIIYSDIDHLITKQNIEEILKIEKEKGTVYPFGRTTEHESDACYLIHKDDFEKVGGYDEDFSGHYGYIDIILKDLFHKHLKVVERRDIKTEYQHSASVNMERDEAFNHQLYQEKKDNYTPTKRIRFKWHKI